MATIEEQIEAGDIRKHSGFLVTERIEGAHPKQPKYPLLPGDLLVQNEHEEGRFDKVYPGIQFNNFLLSEEQRKTLKPVEYLQRGTLEYAILEESAV